MNIDTRGRRQALRALTGMAALAGLSGLARANDKYPDKAITLLVPQPVGGDADAVCRLLQPHWRQALGQSLIIDNRAGAAGNIGTAAGARAPSDGYTLTFVNQSTMAINPFLYKDPGYQVAELEPVSLMTSIDLIICAHPSVPANNLAELLEQARRRPGAFTYGTAGNGSANHLAGEMLKSMAGVNLVHVPYRGGGPAMIGALGGEISTVVAFPLAALPHIRAGKLRALATTGSTRSAALPRVPTVAESGVAGYEFVSWMGLVAPKGTPRSRIDIVDRATRRALAEPDVRQRFTEGMTTAVGQGPEALRELITKESGKMSALISRFHLKID
ncbi:tripartite tricarboxylate transporter substrate binding protein [Pigmentiphaga sp.]|uniref:Bug family tripartite tricarboxylate transporter substrate binding protein n=1 Tax=Pigmentiphaga sp. TaxID=1977564 RepID=UPI0025E08568|nr:tripartite tricarboxylate transporter substrate binding protein [Pigmentiphaga sp.]